MGIPQRFGVSQKGSGPLRPCRSASLIVRDGRIQRRQILVEECQHDVLFCVPVQLFHFWPDRHPLLPLRSSFLFHPDGGIGPRRCRPGPGRQIRRYSSWAASRSRQVKIVTGSMFTSASKFARCRPGIEIRQVSRKVNWSPVLDTTELVPPRR